MKHFIAGFLTALTFVGFVKLANRYPTYCGTIVYKKDTLYTVELSNGHLYEFESTQNYWENDMVEVCMNTKGTDTPLDDEVKSVHLI